MIAEIESEVVSEIKVKMSYKYKEFNAVIFWHLQQFAASAIISPEQLEGCLTEMGLYSTIEAQVEHLGEFANEKKDIIKAVAKHVREHNKPKKAPRAKKGAAAEAVDGEVKKRGRAKKVVQTVVSNEDDVISQLVNAANNTENIVISITEEPVAIVPVAVVKEKKTKAAAKPAGVVDEAKEQEKQAKEQEKLAKEQEKLAKEQEKLAKDAEKAAAKQAKEQEKEAAKQEKEAAKLAKEQEKAAAKAVKDAQPKPIKAVAKAVAKVVAPVQVELVAEVDVDEEDEDEEDEEEEGEGTPFEQNGVKYIVEMSTGKVYNEAVDTEYTELVYADGAIRSR